MLKISDVTLNDFEKKAILNDLKDVGVVNLLPSFFDNITIYYTAFYRYKDFLFCYQLPFTDIHTNKKQRVKQLMKDFKHDIKNEIDYIEEFVYGKGFDPSNIEKTSSKFLSVVTSELYVYEDHRIFDCTGAWKEQITNVIISSIKDGKSGPNTYNECLSSVNLYTEELIEISSNNDLEIDVIERISQAMD